MWPWAGVDGCPRGFNIARMVHHQIVILVSTFLLTICSALTGFDAILTAANGNVTLYCEPDASGVIVKFRRNGQEITNKTGRYLLNPYNSTLTVYFVGESDVGEYQCVQEPNPPTSVFIRSVPVVTGVLAPSGLIEGDTINVMCYAWGYPTPVCSWYRDDRLLTTADAGVSFSNYQTVTNEVIANAQLTIANSRRSDQNDYVCSASNGLNTTTGSTYVRVKDRLAALWPFIGIVIVVVLTVIIIIIAETRRRREEAKLHPQ